MSHHSSFLGVEDVIGRSNDLAGEVLVCKVALEGSEFNHLKSK